MLIQVVLLKRKYTFHSFIHSTKNNSLLTKITKTREEEGERGNYNFLQNLTVPQSSKCMAEHSIGYDKYYYRRVEYGKSMKLSHKPYQRV